MSRLLDPQNFVAEKLAWQLQVLTDTSLTPLAKTLAALLMHVLNSKTGDGYRSQAWLAETLGVTARSIRRACDELEEAGHLRVTVYGVRGKANSYQARLKSEPVAPVVEASARAVEERAPRRTSMSSLRSVRRTVVARKEDARVRPSLSKPNNTPLPPTGAGAPRRAFPRDDIRRAATQARGEGWVASYLDRAAWCEETVSIVCKLRFAADEIRAALTTLPVMSGVQVTFEADGRERGRSAPLFADLGRRLSVVPFSGPREVTSAIGWGGVDRLDSLHRQRARAVSMDHDWRAGGLGPDASPSVAIAGLRA